MNESNEFWNELPTHHSPVLYSRDMLFDHNKDQLYPVPKDITTYVMDDLTVTGLHVFGERSAEWVNPEVEDFMAWVEETSVCVNCSDEADDLYSSGQNFGRYQMTSVDGKSHLDAVVWTSALGDIWQPDHYFLQIEEIAQNLFNEIGGMVYLLLGEDFWSPGGEQFAFTDAGKEVSKVIWEGVNHSKENDPSQPWKRWTLSPDIAVHKNGYEYCT